MKKKYIFKYFLVISASCLALFIASCKKDSAVKTTTTTPVDATPTKLGLFEADSGIYKDLYLDLTKIGTKNLLNDSTIYTLFDTGSGGLVVDGTEILPASMVTSTGFNFSGDSTVVDGITITSQSEMIEYGNDDASTTKVYGNLAYANVTIGNSSGSIVVKRLPFLIYYNAKENDGSTAAQGEFDIMGVSPEYDLVFANNAYITSPFSYFDPGLGLTKGFKMAALGTSHFGVNGPYVANVVSLGLTDADLSSNGFISNTLNFSSGNGYVPVVQGTITYNGKSTSGYILFDTGTTPYSYIEDKTAGSGTNQLDDGSSVSLSTTSGFSYSYTATSTNNITFVENPNTTGAVVSIMGLPFFINNQYLIDFTNHKMGLKGN